MFPSEGFPGLIQAATINIVEPAVVDAPKSSILNAAVAQICRSMRTVKPKQAGMALIVTKKYQILPEEPDRQRRSSQR
jgi:hypothetical protein